MNNGGGCTMGLGLDPSIFSHTIPALISLSHRAPTTKQSNDLMHRVISVIRSHPYNLVKITTSIHAYVIYIGYYTGSRSVWLYIFTRLCKYVRLVKISSHTKQTNTLLIIQQMNQGKSKFSIIYSVAFNCRLTAR